VKGRNKLKEHTEILFKCFSFHFRREQMYVCEHTVGHTVVTMRYIYCVFTYIYSILIEKDLSKCRKVWIKFPCAPLVYLCLSSGDLFIFSIRFCLLIPTFVLSVL